MDKSLIAGMLLGTAVAAGGGASMQYFSQHDPGTALPVAMAQAAPAVSEPPLAAPAAALVSAAPVAATQVVPVSKPAPVDNITPVAYSAPQPERRLSPAFARVIEVRPVEQSISTPRQECRDEAVTSGAQVRDKHQIIGIVSGAVIGGILGNQVGDGRGKDLATVAGAAAGAFGGRKAQQTVQSGKAQVATHQQCETVMDTAIEVIGYDVHYELDGRVSTVRMDYHPGKRIAVDNGRMVI